MFMLTLDDHGRISKIKNINRSFLDPKNSSVELPRVLNPSLRNIGPDNLPGFVTLLHVV